MLDTDATPMGFSTNPKRWVHHVAPFLMGLVGRLCVPRPKLSRQTSTPNPFDEQGSVLDLFWAGSGPKPVESGPKTAPKLPGLKARTVWDLFLVHSN